MSLREFFVLLCLCKRLTGGFDRVGVVLEICKYLEVIGGISIWQ